MGSSDDNNIFSDHRQDLSRNAATTTTLHGLSERKTEDGSLMA
jgi:hypothetical protein